MNKTNHIVLILTLCFSLIFVVYILRTSADVNMTQEMSPSYPSEPAEPSGDDGGDGENDDGGLIESEDISNLNTQDQGSEPDPNDTEIGDTFTGPSGTEYILEEENISQEEEEALAALGYSPAGVWVEVENDGGDGNGDDDKGYSCSGAPNWTCSKKSNGGYSSLSACQSNCKGTPTVEPSITPTVDPSQAQYRCMQCRCH